MILFKKLFYTSFFLLTFSNLINSQITEGSDYDQDGNMFNWKKIGNTFWSIDNASVESYRDGTLIPQVFYTKEWATLTTGAWCYFENNPSKGKLYNWFAVIGKHDNDPQTPNKIFAPEGWYVPTYFDILDLEKHLIINGFNSDGNLYDNSIAKSLASTKGWIKGYYKGTPSYEQSKNNSSGFNAFPVGTRHESGRFGFEGEIVAFWSRTEDSDLVDAWLFYMRGEDKYITINETPRQSGFSVRFVKYY